MPSIPYLNEASLRSQRSLPSSENAIGLPRPQEQSAPVDSYRSVRQSFKLITN